MVFLQFFFIKKTLFPLTVLDFKGAWLSTASESGSSISILNLPLYQISHNNAIFIFLKGHIKGSGHLFKKLIHVWVIRWPINADHKPFYVLMVISENINSDSLVWKIFMVLRRRERVHWERMGLSYCMRKITEWWNKFWSTFLLTLLTLLFFYWKYLNIQIKNTFESR